MWRWDGENVTAARVLANIWQPNQSAVLVYTVDQEELFSDLLPEMELDCMLQLRDGDNNLILEQTAIADAQRWEKNAEGHVRHVYTLPGSGWELTVEGDTTLQTQAMPSDVMLSMGLILAGLCLLMLLVAWNFSHKISSRLNELRQQVNRAVTEEYQNDIVSCDRDEIGEITNAVGTIVHETRQLLQQTYQSELDRRDAQIQAEPHGLLRGNLHHDIAVNGARGVHRQRYFPSVHQDIGSGFEIEIHIDGVTFNLPGYFRNECERPRSVGIAAIDVHPALVLPFGAPAFEGAVFRYLRAVVLHRGHERIVHRPLERIRIHRISGQG